MANSLNVSLVGQVIVVRAEVLLPAYQALHHRVWRVKGGFGASPDSSGRALYCTSLFDGEEARFEGYDVERLATASDLAVVDQARLSS